jgi:transcriptional regulator GlxA family with amidase domain
MMDGEAYMGGFHDINYFRKCFKEEFNINPTEFTKKFERNQFKYFYLLDIFAPLNRYN